MTNNLAAKLLKYPTAIGRMAIVIINNVYCIPTYVVWMTMLMPLKCLQPDIYYKIEGVFFHWLLAVVSMWSYSAGYDIVECGDDIDECRDKRTLVIANHQSTADVPLLMANFNTKDNILPNIMWIMDRLFKYTNFGIVSIIHQDFFIKSGRKNRDESINALKEHIKMSYIKRDRKWMVLFPEGGFLRKRREVSKKFAEKNNLPLLENVTIPRVGALKAIVEAMCVEENFTERRVEEQQDHTSCKCHSGKKLENSTPESLPNGEFFDNKNMNITSNKTKSECLLEYVLDITIAYPNGKPLDLPNILHGWRDPCKTYMLYRLYKMCEIPKDEMALTQWLYDRFIEKNTLLENFYKHGVFYMDRTSNATIIHQDVLRFLLINIFFITSTYFHYQMLCTLYTYCAFLASGTS